MYQAWVVSGIDIMVLTLRAYYTMMMKLFPCLFRVVWGGTLFGTIVGDVLSLIAHIESRSESRSLFIALSGQLFIVAHFGVKDLEVVACSCLRGQVCMHVCWMVKGKWI